MSKLRDQIDQARAQYESIAYPGELATEILRQRATGPRWFFPLIVSGAVAAVSLVMVYRTTEPTHAPKGLVQVLPTPEQVETPVVYPMPSRVPLTLPVAPFMATTPPVTVSLTSFSENLGVFQQGYEELGPKLMHNFNKGLRVPERPPVKNPAPGATPATNESVYLSPFLIAPTIGRA